MIDIRLKVFCSVARHLSYTKAAQELRISQPAVTKHIHELEGAYHVRLIERMGNRIVLTHAGEVLLEHCNLILDEYARLDFGMEMLHGRHSGSLRIGASTTIAQYVLPPLLARFTAKFPDVHLELINGNSDRVEEELMAHHIDLGLIEGNRRLPNLKYSRFLDDELVAVTSVKSPLARRDELSLEELRQTPLVLRENGSGTLDVFTAALAAQGVRLQELKVVMQLGSSESIKLFLENSDTLSILSFRCITREVMQGILKVIELPALDMKRQLLFVQLHGEEEDLSSLFMQFLLHEAAKQ